MDVKKIGSQFRNMLHQMYLLEMDRRNGIEGIAIPRYSPDERNRLTLVEKIYFGEEPLTDGHLVIIRGFEKYFRTWPTNKEHHWGRVVLSQPLVLIPARVPVRPCWDRRVFLIDKQDLWF